MVLYYTVLVFLTKKMANMHITRVKREFREIVSSEEVNGVEILLLFCYNRCRSQAQKCSIKVEILDETDLTRLRGTVAGPPDTPFEGK